MSVIIRLQNLPWSANALDIRTFFRGLAIPDGGVHIVGGEMGDAFIAFSTDEDARQAMLLDRGKINEVQIRLLLSSRTEMQKVIETARQSSLSMMQLAQKQKQQSKPPQQQLQKPIQQKPPIPPQPPVITSASINNILSQPTQHNFGPNENSVQSYNQFNENSMDSRDSRDKYEEHGRSGRDRSHDRDRGRQRYRSRSRSRSRDRRRSRSRDRSGSRRRKDRSVSRDRRDRHRNSRSRDRSRSRENENKNRRDRDTRDPRDQRDKGSLYDHRDSRDPRDPRERLLKGRADNSDTTNIPMVIVDDDEEKDDAFSPPKKNVNIWDVPPPTIAPPNNYNQQGFKLFGQSQVPSYQSSENKMNPYNPMRNLYQEQNKHTGMQQSQPPMATQQNKFPQQQPHYQSLAQNFSTLQNQQYEAFKNAIRTPSINQGVNQQSSEKMQPDKTNSQTTTGNESKDNPILNFQNLVSSNLMSSLNYFGSNSKSTPFTNPYTLASKTGKEGSPAAKEENNPAGGRSTTSFSGLFGNNSNKDEYVPKNVNEGMGNANQSKGSEISSPKDPFIQRGGSDANKSPQAQDPKEINYDEIKGNCIKISNMCPSTSYSDLRRFFSGLYIANNGIKMINDKHGLRIGVAYVHFVRPESKPKAFIRNGLALKSKKVIIESCTEEDFDEVVDSYKPARKPSRFEQAEERNSLNKKDDSDKTGEDGSEKVIEETPFTALLLEDVPPFATEQNIIKMFSSYTLIDIILTKDEESRKQLIGYVKFHRADDAKKALEEKSSHLIGHKQVFVSRCSDEDFDKAKEKQNMPPEVSAEEEEQEEEPEQPEEPKEPKEPKDQDNAFNPFKKLTENKPPASNNSMTQNFDETQQSMSNMSEMDSQIPSLLSMPPGPGIDPRRRGGRQGSRFNRPEENTNRQGSTPFVLIKNCDYKSTKYDFADIFLNMGITPNRIEILYNNRQLPSGECIVEFTRAEDAEKAAARNNTKCGNRMVRIELVPPSFVVDRLGENFLNQGNNRPDGFPKMSPFNGNNTEMNRNFGPNMNMNNMNSLSNMNSLNNMNSLSSMNSLNNMNMNMGMGGPFNNNMNNMNMNNMGGINNIPDNNMMGNQSAFRPGGNNVNSNRRGPKKSRFSDYNENSRSFGNNQSNNGNNMPTNMPPNMNMHPNMSQNMPPNMPPPLNNSSVDQFGQPDCVVGMENVPYKAGIEDILEFFRKFNVQPHNVIRRYNDDGTPTGDARVAFSSPMEARAAIESKRNQKIFNRTIFLSIV